MAEREDILAAEREYQATLKAWRFGSSFAVGMTIFFSVLLALLIIFRFDPEQVCAVALYLEEQVGDGNGKVNFVENCMEWNQRTLFWIAIIATGGLIVSQLINLVVLRKARVELEGHGYSAKIGGDHGEANGN